MGCSYLMKNMMEVLMELSCSAPQNWSFIHEDAVIRFGVSPALLMLYVISDMPKSSGCALVF